MTMLGGKGIFTHIAYGRSVEARNMTGNEKRTDRTAELATAVQGWSALAQLHGHERGYIGQAVVSIGRDIKTVCWDEITLRVRCGSNVGILTQKVRAGTEVRFETHSVPGIDGFVLWFGGMYMHVSASDITAMSKDSDAMVSIDY